MPKSRIVEQAREYLAANAAGIMYLTTEVSA